MRLWGFITVLLVIVSCVGKQNKKMSNEYMQRMDIVKERITNIDKDISFQEDLLNLDLYRGEIPSDEVVFVYILDSSCSICIATMIDFAKIVRDLYIGKPLLVLIPEDSRHIVEYYISQNGFENSNVQVLPMRDTVYTSQVWAEQNSMVYVVSDGKIVNKYNHSKLQFSR